MNRWVALFADPRNGGNARIHSDFRGSTQAQINAYNDSIMALTIPQGVQADQRIGADINVVGDSWRFEWYCNSVDPSNTTTATAVSTLHPRVLKIRMVGVFQPTLLEPGDVGYLPTEMFEDAGSRISRFKRGDAQGYKVFYDKTKTLNVYEFNSASVNQPRRALPAVFAANLKYRRSYAISTTGTGEHGAPQDGNTTGVEIATNVLTTSPATSYTSVNGGTARGQVLWYYFIEDTYPANGGTTANTWFYPEYGFGCSVSRRTYWQDA